MFYFRVQSEIKNTDKTFIYKSLVDLSVGQLVKIELGPRKLNGWIIGRVEEAELTELGIAKDKVLDIKKTYEKYVAEDLLKVTDWLSKYLICSKASLLRFCEPSKEAVTIESCEYPHKKIELCENNFFVSPYLSRLKVIKELAEKTKHKKHLFIVPSVNIAEAWSKSIKDKNIIVGTRKTIFSSIANLGSINVFDSLHELYYEQKKPYFNLMDVARVRAEVLGIELNAINVFFNSARIDKRFTGSNQDISFYKIEKDSNKDLSSKALKTIGEEVFFLLNRPLEDSNFICNRCKKVNLTNTKCEICGSTNFYSIGLGHSNFAKSIAKLLPKINFSVGSFSDYMSSKQKFDTVVFLDSDRYVFSSINNYLSQGMAEITAVIRKQASLRDKTKIIFESNTPRDEKFYNAILGSRWDYWNQLLEVETENLGLYPKAINVLIGGTPNLDLELGSFLFGEFEGNLLLQFPNDVEFLLNQVPKLKTILNDADFIKINSRSF
jgi:hypothetical protein